ncbi:SMP-30/gluconolactonase/LRE family protein [Commensalibacter sp. A3DC]|uniref:SMP-30/gluconolactonase/LRE family protein n=1 Tax=Commensalibacter sp. A3DC TaxID=3093920 RepID=UPI0039B40967
MITINSSCPSAIWETQSELGEGVMWNASEKAVYFVDIEGKKIHQYRLNDNQKKSWNTHKKPTFFFPTNQSVYLCGMEDGLYWFSLFNGSVTLFYPLEEKFPNNRINDGYVDAKGQLWFGSMDEKEKKLTGSLYLLKWDQAKPYVIRQDREYAVLNGPVIDEDKQILYCSHSNAHEIFSFDIEDGQKLANKRLFLKEMEGYPDGMALDCENNLWVCLYQGYKINVYSSDGQKLKSIDFPCPNLTKIAFGGNDLKTAFVTSARAKISKKDLEKYPKAGALFTFDNNIAGKRQNIFHIPDEVRLEE